MLRIDLKPTRELSKFEKARRDCVIQSSFYIYWNDFVYAEPDWTILVWEGEEAVSAIEIFERTIQVGGKPLRVGGVGNHATKTEWRKRGYATHALLAAQDFLRDTLRVEFGLGFCKDNLVPFYEKFGWQVVAERVLVEQPGRSRYLEDKIIAFSTRGLPWPPGEIDLRGLPW
ncbi:MAG: GNAT family N-acetyltransferase [Anaerolineales bacterium]|nr:GNAT family N-acetyltransferase [Anaerolineales bacterium]MCX7608561.1 GNAT family N-acetyltransferase [Anaerolineales bacterium]MDW8227931.1 GNAT family N-acetyltransferase [Anaerolineales bacterium]